MAAVCAAAAASPFVGSRSEPHAVLYLNYKMIPRQIYPVRIWMVDGKLTNRSDQMVVWMKPGNYALTIKLTKVVNMDYTPGLTQKMPDAKQMHDLKLSVQAGKAYYIGAKFDSSGKWQPEIWKTADIK
ncbi:MAG: hypothetical protein ACRETL_12970 [Gammaproteobacteria bacterium]